MGESLDQFLDGSLPHQEPGYSIDDQLVSSPAVHLVLMDGLTPKTQGPMNPPLGSSCYRISAGVATGAVLPRSLCQRSRSQSVASSITR